MLTKDIRICIIAGKVRALKVGLSLCTVEMLQLAQSFADDCTEFPLPGSLSSQLDPMFPLKR